jgi:choline-glycine betaine transporter
MLILVLVFVLDKTNYILNLFTQEIGYYFQWSILQLNFHTDAFGQLETGEGRAIDGMSAER